MGLALNNLQRLICHKTTNKHSLLLTVCKSIVAMLCHRSDMYVCMCIMKCEITHLIRLELHMVYL